MSPESADPSPVPTVPAVQSTPTTDGALLLTCSLACAASAPDPAPFRGELLSCAYCYVCAARIPAPACLLCASLDGSPVPCPDSSWLSSRDAFHFAREVRTRHRRSIGGEASFTTIWEGALRYLPLFANLPPAHLAHFLVQKGFS